MFGSIAYFCFVVHGNQSETNQNRYEQYKSHEKYATEVIVATSEKASTYEHQPSKWENNEEIKILRQYLQIPTVHPNINYSRKNHLFHKILKSITVTIFFTQSRKNQL